MPVAYAGFKNDNDGPFGTIVSVDPKAEAAKAGIRKGDRILGYWPSSSLSIKLIPEKIPAHDYGLKTFAPYDEINFGVLRGTKEMKFKFTPEVSLDIATQPALVLDRNALDKFLELKQ